MENGKKKSVMLMNFRNFRLLCYVYTKRSKKQIGDKFRKIFDNKLQRRKQGLSLI